VERIEAAIAGAGGPVEASEDAGGFICNDVFHAVLRRCHEGLTPGLLRAGFIHVPNDRFVPVPIAQASVNAAVVAAVRATLEDLGEEELPRVRG
jgi:pyroglutamyl-peptidase